MRKTDWMLLAISLILSLAFYILYRHRPGVFQEMDRRFISQKFLWRDRFPTLFGDPRYIEANRDRIAIIEINDPIDKDSIVWPYSRAVHAELLNFLLDAGVRAVGFDLLFFNRNRDQDGPFLKALTRGGERVVLGYFYNHKMEMGASQTRDLFDFKLPHRSFCPPGVNLGFISVNRRLPANTDGAIRQFEPSLRLRPELWDSAGESPMEFSELSEWFPESTANGGRWDSFAVGLAKASHPEARDTISRAYESPFLIDYRSFGYPENKGSLFLSPVFQNFDYASIYREISATPTLLARDGLAVPFTGEIPGPSQLAFFHPGFFPSPGSATVTLAAVFNGFIASGTISATALAEIREQLAVGRAKLLPAGSGLTHNPQKPEEFQAILDTLNRQSGGFKTAQQFFAATRAGKMAERFETLSPRERERFRRTLLEIAWPDLVPARFAGIDYYLRLLGKIILVIPNTTTSHDEHPTTIGLIPGGFIHAYATLQMLNGIRITSLAESPSHGPLSLVIFLALGLLVFVITDFCPLFKGLLMFVVSLLALFTIDLATFGKGHYLFLDSALFFLSPFFTYCLMVLSRYFIESMERSRLQDIFGKYVSPKLLDEIEKNPNVFNLGGEHREATVFFLDVCGFTTFSETRTPKEVLTALNQYYQFMCEIIDENEGIVQTFMGDAIMAVFGAPVPDPDHAKKAVRTAIKVLRELKIFNSKRADNDRLNIRIGINSGRVVAGNIGSTIHMEYTVIGDTVNLGARLEKLSAHGTFTIGERTAELVKDEFNVVFREKVKVKGKNIEVNTFGVEIPEWGQVPTTVE